MVHVGMVTDGRGGGGVEMAVAGGLCHMSIIRPMLALL